MHLAPRLAIRLASAVATAAMFAGPALATENISVGHFTQVELRGGGHVVVKHGATQSVTLVKGSTQYTSFKIREGRKLVIDACNDHCPNSYDLEIEIVSPDLDAAAIDGGGEIVAQGSFPGRDRLALAVNGGGDIDMRPIKAAEVDAAVNGGGDIHLTATRALNAAVSGGGDISYRGNPQVNEAVQGGGDVQREGS
ncbi:MAG: DUF2807 domain-containing protein [Alphaproteobacteria bacterium]|nr:DUF2807 domain-containing protein [Alphaproteobacteria bacterium]